MHVNGKWKPKDAIILPKRPKCIIKMFKAPFKFPINSVMTAALCLHQSSWQSGCFGVWEGWQEHPGGVRCDGLCSAVLLVLLEQHRSLPGKAGSPLSLPSTKPSITAARWGARTRSSVCRLGSEHPCACPGTCPLRRPEECSCRMLLAQTCGPSSPVCPHTAD